MKPALQRGKQGGKIGCSPGSLVTETFETLYNRYAGQVFQKCLSMTNDDETARDFTQDIFIKVFDKLDTFESRSAFSTWLYSISHNYCVDQIRVRKRYSSQSLHDCPTTDFADDLSTSVEHRLQTLEKVLQYISDEELTFLRLKHEQGQSIKELAARYCLTESAVKMRLKRIRDKLQKLYIDHEQD